MRRALALAQIRDRAGHVGVVDQHEAALTALLAGHDVRAVAPDVLRHRVLPSYEATAEGWDGDRIVQALLDVVPVP